MTMPIETCVCIYTCNILDRKSEIQPPERWGLLRAQILRQFYTGHVNITRDMWHETVLINAGMSIESPTILKNTGSMTTLTISQLPSVTWRNVMIFQLLYPSPICKILTDINSLILFCKPSSRRTSISPKFAVQFPESVSAAVSCRSVSTTGLASWLSIAHSQHVTPATVTYSSKVRSPISSSQLSVK